MKKKIFILGLSICFIFASFLLNFQLDANEKAYAFNTNNQFVVVIGNGKVEASPDNANLNFGIKIQKPSIKEGQEEMLNIYNNICEKIKQIDENAVVYVNYSSCYPVGKNGIVNYEFNYDITVNTKNLDTVDSIISTASENGATSFYSSCYTLENKQELYNQALKTAKENAIEKASSLYSNLTLKELFEVSIYSYNQGTKDGKIIIEAKVKARFELLNDTTMEDDNKIPNQDVNDEVNEDGVENDEVTNQQSQNNEYAEKNETTNSDLKNEEIVDNSKNNVGDNHITEEEMGDISNEEKSVYENNKDMPFGISY